MTLALSLCGPHRALPTHAELQDARAGKDPTKTYYLRARMRAEGDRRWQTLAQTVRQALIEHDLIGMRGIGRLPYADKAEGFAAWLREELRHKVFGLDGRWLRPYVQQAAVIAQKHVNQLAPGGKVDSTRVATMENFAVSELRGICEAAQQQMIRVVTHSIMANDTPTQAANALSGVIKTMRNRTRAMSEYVIAKTHGTCTLSAFRDAGVQQVGIIPERLRKRRVVQGPHGKTLVSDWLRSHSSRVTFFTHERDIKKLRSDNRTQSRDAKQPVGGPGSRVSRTETPSAATIARIERAQEKIEEVEGIGGVEVVTAGDEDVCVICEDISDEGPYDLDTAESLIPAHAWCRCSFYPAGETTDALWDWDPEQHPRGKTSEQSTGGSFAPGELPLSGGGEPEPGKNRFIEALESGEEKIGQTWMQRGSTRDVQKLARDAVVSVGDDNFETAVIVGEHRPDGTLVGAAPAGGAHSVGVSPKLIAKFGVHELHHNHPSPLPVSGPDISLLNRRPGELAVWAHTDDASSKASIPGRDAEHPNMSIVGDADPNVYTLREPKPTEAFDRFLMEYHDEVGNEAGNTLQRLQYQLRREFADEKELESANRFVLYHPLVQGLVNAGLVKHDYQPGAFERGLLRKHGRAIKRITEIADRAMADGIKRHNLHIADVGLN